MRFRVFAPRNLVIASALLVALVTAGTAWYAWVEDFSFVDALYQTVIIFTVGFSEVEPLDVSGRAFTVVLILLGIGIMFYVASAVVELALLGRVAEAFGVRRRSRRMRNMRDHYVVCGYGRVGGAVAEELQGHGVEIVVIEQDGGRIAAAQDREMLTIAGDATEESMLLQAHIESAKVLVAATEADASNTFIALTARALNPDIFIVAGARSESAESRLRTAGANRVYSLHRIAGRRMALAAMQPMIVDVADTLVGMRPGTVLAELVVAEEAEELAGQTIDEAFAGLGSTRVLGLERGAGALTVGPPGDTTLRHGDRLMLYGAEAEIERLSHDR